MTYESLVMRQIVALFISPVVQRMSAMDAARALSCCFWLTSDKLMEKTQILKLLIVKSKVGPIS